jgi:hypothetical protein
MTFDSGRERPPSRWHDDAAERDAGHDEMQIQALEWLNRPAKPKLKVEDNGKIFTYVWGRAEFPFIAAGRLRGFADVAAQFEWTSDDGKIDDYYWIFCELKPRIQSCGAVIRQCSATDILAESHFASQIARRGGYYKPGWTVKAVVYEDDPRLELLAKLSPYRIMTLPRSAERSEA